MKHQEFDRFAIDGDANAAVLPSLTPGRSSAVFEGLKRTVDITFSLVLMPVLLVACLVLLIANLRYNPGTLFFVQTRMGKDTDPFQAIKFRSMRSDDAEARGAHDPLEKDRITPLGHILRKTRLDELPQIINVLRGDMSLIGPRPDYYDHAVEYVASIPGYRSRHIVKPGISGYAQTEVGYADTMDAVAAKVAADLYYIRNRRTRLEAWIFWRTLVIVFGRRGV